MLRLVIAHIDRHTRCELQLGTNAQTILISLTFLIPMVPFYIDSRPTSIFESLAIFEGITIGYTLQGMKVRIEDALIRSRTVPVEAELAFTRHIFKAPAEAVVMAQEAMVIEEMSTIEATIILRDTSIPNTYVEGCPNIRGPRNTLLRKPYMARRIIVMP